ncbi:hypothetical protein [Pseudonocardia sp. D17]|uniref:hypothetical protein n=1 Tax=Pseudonocardia sp. D17 TaxID=882661 RepID=UPI002B3E0C66|nr:hypothetical protein PSD17_39240 [Pseudonocardia sp. D17]
MTPETLVAIGGIITALLAGSTAFVAKRGEATHRQMMIDRDWTERLQRRVVALTRYTFALETACAAAGVPTPPKPAELLEALDVTAK